MASKYYGRAAQRDRFEPKQKAPNLLCQKTKYDNERAYLCHAPTLAGAQNCEKCAKVLLTGGDRKPLPDQPAPKPYGWASEQIFSRKRA